MPTATSLVETFSSQVSENVEKAQAEALKAVRSWTETIEGTLPDSITGFELVESLPKPDAILEMAFELTRKVLDYQADVAKTLAGIVDPVLGRFGIDSDSANGSSAKPAASTTASASKTTGKSATKSATKSTAASSK